MQAGINRIFFSFHFIYIILSRQVDFQYFFYKSKCMPVWIKNGCPGFLTPQIGRPD